MMSHLSKTITDEFTNEPKTSRCQLWCRSWRSRRGWRKSHTRIYASRTIWISPKSISTTMTRSLRTTSLNNCFCDVTELWLVDCLMSFSHWLKMMPGVTGCVKFQCFRQLSELVTSLTYVTCQLNAVVEANCLCKVSMFSSAQWV
jgi:hypothetical protein